MSIANSSKENDWYVVNVTRNFSVTEHLTYYTSFWKQNGYLKQKISSSLELISQINEVIKFLPKSKTMHNPVIKPLFCPLSVSSTQLQPTPQKPLHQNKDLELNYQGDRVLRAARKHGIIPKPRLSWQSHHLWPFTTWATKSTVSYPRELGVHAVLPLQAEAHQLLLMYFKIQSSISLSLRRERGGTHGDQKSIISSAVISSARYCPLCLFFLPARPGKRRASESSNAWPHSLSHNRWGTRLKRKLDCILWALQFSSPVCFYVGTTYYTTFTRN